MVINRKIISEETRRRMSESAKKRIRKSHSIETRKKMSEAAKRRSIETRRKLSESKKGINNPNFGKHISEYQKNRIRETIKGKPRSEETKRRMSIARKGKVYRIGFHHSQETKKKISQAHKGVKNIPPSKETREKLAKARFGTHLSLDTRIKISKALKGKYILEKSSNWKGGLSHEPYTIEWSRSLKRLIRERDNYQCQLCSMLQNNVAFLVHHIDYDKKNCSLNNLITLCRSCHTKTNFKRDYWYLFFSQLMNARYGGQDIVK